MRCPHCFPLTIPGQTNHGREPPNPAGRVHKRDRLLDALPIAPILLDPILKSQCMASAMHGDVGNALAIPRPVPAA
jgi:hypothetical protein